MGQYLEKSEKEFEESEGYTDNKYQGFAFLQCNIVCSIQDEWQ